jgi:hypothetical protein
MYYELTALLAKHREYGGNKWSKIAEALPGRTHLQIRDRWRMLLGTRRKTNKQEESMQQSSKRIKLSANGNCSASAAATLGSFMPSSSLKGAQQPFMRAQQSQNHVHEVAKAAAVVDALVSAMLHPGEAETKPVGARESSEGGIGNSDREASAASAASCECSESVVSRGGADGSDGSSISSGGAGKPAMLPKPPPQIKKCPALPSLGGGLASAGTSSVPSDPSARGRNAAGE